MKDKYRKQIETEKHREKWKSGSNFCGQVIINWLFNALTFLSGIP